MMELRDKEDKTILFVSHSLPQVRSFCKTGLWIEGGKLIEYGDIETVSAHYEEYVNKLNAMKAADKKKMLEEKFQSRLIKEEPKHGLLDRLFGK
ncbi:MAG: ABC transporter ATP-binding protein, partial [Longicatena sp.]|nr:ABC transporter ATP-binding protein [Longicatena sp.]